jgi:hypothetical protein
MIRVIKLVTLIIFIDHISGGREITGIFSFFSRGEKAAERSNDTPTKPKLTG